MSIEIVQEFNREDGTWKYTVFCSTQPEAAQANVMMDALAIYAERNIKYKDNWKRMGWRGCLVRLRERTERLWDQFWDGPVLDGELSPDRHPTAIDTDDAIDMINFAAFWVRGVRGEATRDGEWWS